MNLPTKKEWDEDFGHGVPPPEWYKNQEMLSQLIGRLEKLMGKVGDIPVCMKGVPAKSHSNIFFGLEALNDDDYNLFPAIGIHSYNSGNRLDI